MRTGACARGSAVRRPNPSDLLHPHPAQPAGRASVGPRWRLSAGALQRVIFGMEVQHGMEAGVVDLRG